MFLRTSWSFPPPGITALRSLTHAVDLTGLVCPKAEQACTHTFLTKHEVWFSKCQKKKNPSRDWKKTPQSSHQMSLLLLVTFQKVAPPPEHPPVGSKSYISLAEVSLSSLLTSCCAEPVASLLGLTSLDYKDQPGTYSTFKYSRYFIGGTGKLFCIGPETKVIILMEDD